jgi:putative membrane protein
MLPLLSAAVRIGIAVVKTFPTPCSSGDPMSRSVAVRLLAAALVAASVACSRGDRTPQADTSAGQVGVIDSAPASVATTVAAMITDENVFALLDTAFAAMIATDRLAQNKTQGVVNQFASKSVSENAVTRSGIKSTAERLNIAPVLPDRDVIRDQADAMRDLEARSGADFNRAYLDRVIQVRKDLIDEIDDALEKGGVRQEPVRKFLSEVRVNLDAARTAAEDLRAKQG